jgi:hypothetical protein
VHFDCYQTSVQPFSSVIQQFRTFNKVQYLADSDVKVTWFHKMTTQVPESLMLPKPHSHKERVKSFQMPVCI